MARSVILYIATSLDGFVARENGSVDWLFTEGNYDFEGFFARVDTVLMGRTTYEQVLGFGAYPYEARDGYVFSHSRAGQRDAHVEFTDADPREVVERLRARPGADIWLVGGGELATAFVSHGLVDELHLAVHPVLLGRGRRLFGEHPVETWFELLGSQSHPDGLVELRYRRRSG